MCVYKACTCIYLIRKIRQKFHIENMYELGRYYLMKYPGCFFNPDNFFGNQSVRINEAWPFTKAPFIVGLLFAV